MIPGAGVELTDMRRNGVMLFVEANEQWEDVFQARLWVDFALFTQTCNRLQSAIRIELRELR